MTTMVEQRPAIERVTPTTDQEPACWRCGRTLGEYMTRPWSVTCKRCKAQNRQPPCTEPEQPVS